MDIKKYQSSSFHNQVEGIVRQLHASRVHTTQPVDSSLADFLQSEHKLSLAEFYAEIGVDPGFDTIQNFYMAADNDLRWVVPEIYREAISLGYRQAPLWPKLTAVEEATNGLSQIIPHINMSDALPKKLGESTTIPVGNLSYGEKKFSIYKYGRGLKISDEVKRYVSLKVVSIYLRDFGVKMGYGVDNLALETLINGEQAGGTEAAPIIGVGTTGTLTFRDLLRVWIRMAKIGRKPSILINGEDMALDVMHMDEFYKKEQGKALYKLNKDVVLPTGADMYIHGGMSSSQIAIVDPTSSLIKLNAQPVTIESERIVSNQSEAIYVTFATGFAKLFTDATLILDSSQPFSSNGFPEEMDYITRIDAKM